MEQTADTSLWFRGFNLKNKTNLKIVLYYKYYALPIRHYTLAYCSIPYK